MFNNPKYICTKNNEIIVFGAGISHDTFKHLNPVGAGFISFGVNENGNPTCSCYGDSYSLKLKAREVDTVLAKIQLNINKI